MAESGDHSDRRAQKVAASGLILPIVAVFLLVAVNRRSLLDRFVNGPIANGFGVLVVLIVAGLGYRKLAWAIKEMFP